MSTPAEDRKALIAHLGPFVLFMIGLALVQLVQAAAGKSGNFLFTKPEYWVYPLQTLACGISLAWWWKSYDLGPRRPLLLAAGIGLLVFVLWVSPQLVFRQPVRLDGFDPSVFATQPALYWSTVFGRFVRLVIVVPFVEEIFWRGFLQRYLIDENFTHVPFGKYTPFSFWGVVLGFMLIHQPSDWPAALVTGAIYGLIAIRTKSLIACVTAHAVTNLALGCYIMTTHQWGFW